MWPWNLTNDIKIGHLYHAPSSFHRSHLWIQTEVTARKPAVRVKIIDFAACVILEFDGRPWKIIGHLFCTTSSLVYHFSHLWIQTGVMVRKLPNRAKICFDIWLWPLTSDLDLLYGHRLCQWNQHMIISWWYYDGNIYTKKGVTDRQTDWTVHRAAW